MTAVTSSPPVPDDSTPTPPHRGMRRILAALVIVAALVIAAGAGYLVGHRDNTTNTPDASSVDAGFAWDMTVHHRQAVSMAGYTRDHTTDPLIKSLAYDIETSQFNQVGQMQGWLDAWGLPVSNPNPVMQWMAASGHDHVGSDGLMPGIATQAQMDQLQSASGKALDVLFLQLMLHHHQGGLPMAQWAATHASESYVRNAAQKMADSQSGEIVQLEQLLRERGASPLPPPD
ncbi:MAG: hypothetical protein JWN95_1191 [Frankiales bacterium]|nr:hypothetical protein [Frankiales bacterium]